MTTIDTALVVFVFHDPTRRSTGKFSSVEVVHWIVSVVSVLR